MRQFEESQLTKDILNAIAIALENLKPCGLSTKLDELFDKIKNEKLDIKLVSRED